MKGGAMNVTKKDFFSKRYAFVARLLLCILLLAAFGVIGPCAAEKSAPLRAPYLFVAEKISGGQGISGNSSICVYENYTLPENECITMEGWFVTDEGIDRYEYAWVTGLDRTPEWETAQNTEITPRPDLAAAAIPYPGGYDTAGYFFSIEPPENLTDGYYDLYVRAITGDGVSCDMVLFSHMMYGTPDADDGSTRTVSFPRLEKTPGALTEAAVEDTGLVMTNQSMISLGAIELNAFGRVRITYTVSQSYSDGKQALVGFKSAPDHLYGDGEGLYDLTDHITAMPLSTAHDGPQVAELDLSDVAIPFHNGLYMSAYIKDGVTLTLHSIEFIYRGKGFDRTAAKIYFSEDLIPRFTGRNLVDLKGVQDPVMGDVLRIEVIDNTNDPFTHFNASGVLKDHDLRLSADDYKYMVVLARASKNNAHSSMTFYLCAGNIVGATEACTYTHQLIPDDKWHYYVFDLTERENWKGIINGWRFDIINGDCLPGNYVDFASIQLFRTPEAAVAAAKASVTQGITPHALGMPAVTRDDVEETVISDRPMTFAKGDWFEETTIPETEPVTPPAETLPPEPAETNPPIESESPTLPAATETQAPEGGCGSAAGLSPFTLLTPFILISKKKNRRIEK